MICYILLPLQPGLFWGATEMVNSGLKKQWNGLACLPVEWGGVTLGGLFMVGAGWEEDETMGVLLEEEEAMGALLEEDEATGVLLEEDEGMEQE